MTNLNGHPNRSCFTVVNGISSVQWYTDPTTNVPYSNLLTHNTNQNIVKIDIANINLDWRVFYLGVCDSNQNILPFYVIQTDQGLCAPVQTTIQFIPLGGRISILLDLTTVISAYLFLYDYDLTANYGMTNSTTGTFPDFTQSSATPYPSPIPDPLDNNQPYLDYPIISLIPQITQTLVNGYYPVPNTSAIRPFLHVTNTSGENNLSLPNILTTIDNIIYKNGIPPSHPNNYFSTLNPNYYYNIPQISSITPSRMICLWREKDINYVNGGSGNTYIIDNTGNNVYGVTECCNGANRIRVDLWNSDELDINQALIAYSKSPNNYKPSILPTSEFRVTPNNDQYINIAEISNDMFTIQGFYNNISYDDNSTIPVFSVNIILPPTDPRANLNIQQWINLLNHSLTTANININGHKFLASNILLFDWSFFPYGIKLLNGTTNYLKSAVIKTTNFSNYYISLYCVWYN